MKNKAALVFMIISAFMLLLSTFTARIKFGSNSFLSDKLIQEGVTYSSKWLLAIQVNNLLFVGVLITTIVCLILAFREWIQLKYYNPSIIKKINIVGYLFIVEGFISLTIFFGTTGVLYSHHPQFMYARMNIFEGFFILSLIHI